MYIIYIKKMMNYRVLIQNYTTKKKKLFYFKNKHLLKQHLRTLNNAYVEVEINRCIETFYIQKYNQDIWIDI